MRILILTVLLSAAAWGQSTPTQIKTTLIGNYEWSCKTAGGTLIKGSYSENAVFEACTNKALEVPGQVYHIYGAHYEVKAIAGTAPPATRSVKVGWSQVTRWTNSELIPSTKAVTYKVYQWVPDLDGGNSTRSEAATVTNVLETTISDKLIAGNPVCFFVIAIVDGVQSTQSNEDCKTW